MRICLFCEVILTGRNRAKEHVLRKEWLKELDHLKTNMPVVKHTKDGFLSETDGVVANQLLTGEVCERCNSGWMNYLDIQVDKILMTLARSHDEHVEITKNDRRTLGRWILKTACTFIYTDSKNRRHIPRSVLLNVRRANYLPRGFVGFLMRSNQAVKGIAAANLDMWIEVEGVRRITELPQSKRLKFGVQYDNLLIGCSYVDIESPIFIAKQGIHNIFVSSRAEVRFEYDPVSDINDLVTFSDGMYENPLNAFLLSLAVF